MLKPRLTSIAVGLLAAAIAGSPAQAATAVDIDTADADAITIEITNNYQLDVRIFVVGEDGRSQDIGTVRRLNTKTLSVSEDVLEGAGTIRIKVVSLEAATPHTLAQRALDGVKTAPFAVENGERIQLVVQEGLTLSVLGEG